MLKDRHTFLCYSTKDRRFVDKLYTDLVGLGVPIWLDRVELKAGDSLPGEIGSAISSAEFFIIVISPHSINSKWVRHELRIALTKQIEEEERFVIPIVRGRCELPPFLRGSLYISFENSKNYARNLEQLLRSIDRKPKSYSDLNNQEFIATKETTFVEDIQQALSEATGDDDWMSEFSSLPLTRMLTSALKLHSFGGGQIQREIALALAMASHAGGGIESNNLVALMGFLKDAEELNVTTVTYIHLLVSLVEDVNIGTDYRWWALSWLLKRLKSAKNRRLQLELLPDIFPSKFFDALADKLIAEFVDGGYDGKGGLLSELWVAGPSYYREEIVAYATRIGHWTRPPQLPREVGTTRDARPLRQALRKGWEGPKFEQEGDFVSEAGRLLKEAIMAQSPAVDEILSLVEQISRARQGKRLDATAILIDILSSSNGLDDLREKHGDGVSFQVTASVIASPFTDIVLSLLILYSCAHNFGLDSLLYHPRFPGCLLVPKRGSLYSGLEEISILGGLVESIIGDRDDNPAYLVLLQLLAIFPHPPIYAALSMQISRAKEMTPELLNIRRIFSGDASASELIADLLKGINGD